MHGLASGPVSQGCTEEGVSGEQEGAAAHVGINRRTSEEAVLCTTRKDVVLSVT